MKKRRKKEMEIWRIRIRSANEEFEREEKFEKKKKKS